MSLGIFNRNTNELIYFGNFDSKDSLIDSFLKSEFNKPLLEIEIKEL